MKQIHIWPNHIRIPHLDLVIFRSQPATLQGNLRALARLGFDTGPGNVDVHDPAPIP